MAKYTQEITTNTNDLTSKKPGQWKLSSNRLELGLYVAEGVTFAMGDVIELIFKTPIANLNDTTSYMIETPYYGESSKVSFVTSNLGVLNSDAASEAFFRDEFTKAASKLSTASEANPVKITFVIYNVPTTSSLRTFFAKFYLLDSLYIDYKKVKALNVDGKNFKKFVIDGHEYDFRRANLPADEQTELQVLIDGYDWTHLSATAKSLAANSLTWDQISGEPAIHAGVTVTGIVHPAIDADGTLVATISFSRLLSDGTTDLATKQVNIAFVAIKAAPFTVWYGDDLGNVYKDGVKTYTHFGTAISSIVSKDSDVWYGCHNGEVYKNGTLISNSTSMRIVSMALDANGNVYSCSVSQVFKNGTSVSYWQKDIVDIAIAKNNDIYIAISVTNEYSVFKNGSGIAALGKGVPLGIYLDKDSNWYIGANGDSGNNYGIFKNNTNSVHYHVDDSAQLATMSTFTIDKDGNGYNANETKTISKNGSRIYTGISYWGNIKRMAVDSRNNDVYWSTTDKKVYKNNTVLYTAEGSNVIVCLSTEYNGKSGAWGE